MKLSEEEEAQLKALQEKSEAPEESSNGGGSSTQHIVNYTIDLDKPEQVSLAQRMGWLPSDEEEEGEEEEEEEEEAPQRKRGYFKDE